jgi:hypothetical protein
MTQRLRITKGLVGGSFTRNTRITFGHGGDHSSYVSQLNAGNTAPVKFKMANKMANKPSGNRGF